MAIPWLVVLQSVPWTEVIKNAPKVADGARKLWGAVGKRPPLKDHEIDVSVVAPASETPTLAALQTRLAAMEIATQALDEQMLASSELIKSLAEQNAQLIVRIEANRVRLIWLAAATAVFGAMASAGLVLWLVR